MHSHLLVVIAFLGVVSAPEASTVPGPTSDPGNRTQDQTGFKRNGSHGPMQALLLVPPSHGLLLELMTQGAHGGQDPVDLKHPQSAHTTAYPSKDSTSPGDSRLGSGAVTPQSLQNMHRSQEVFQPTGTTCLTGHFY